MEINETILKNIVKIAIKESLTDITKQAILITNKVLENPEDEHHCLIAGLAEAVHIIELYNIDLAADNLVEQIYEMTAYNKET